MLFELVQAWDRFVRELRRILRLLLQRLEPYLAQIHCARGEHRYAQRRKLICSPCVQQHQRYCVYCGLVESTWSTPPPPNLRPPPRPVRHHQ